MTVERYKPGEPIKIEALVVDATVDPVTGADLKVQIQRVSDFYSFNGVGWQPAAITLSMTEVDTINAPGWWTYTFTDPVGVADEFVVTVTDNSGLAANVPQISKAIMGGQIQDDLAMIQTLAELAAAVSVGRARYNPGTSKLELFKWDDPGTVIATFDIKDAAGDPAGLSPQFERIPV